MRLTCLFAILLTASISCDDEDIAPQRSYRMGFQNSAPRFDNFDLFIQSLNLWTQRADVATMRQEVPWAALLGGTTPEQYVQANFKALADYYRGKGFELWVYVDPQNGLERTSEATELQQAGRSITEPAIQDLYRQYVLALDKLLQPRHLGLAMETNLIRDGASDAVYAAIKTAANAAAAALRSQGSRAKLSISIQVEHAWGRLGIPGFKGIDQDVQDFPFAEELGLSSYPYFAFDSPQEIPDDYYSRLLQGKDLPVFVTEGGWSSVPVNALGRSVASSPSIQAEYIREHHDLLMSVGAIAVFQLTFTDLDLTGLPSQVPDNISLFAYLGLVDASMQPKPALDAWDEIFMLPFQER